jgi:hypothetical protein
MDSGPLVAGTGSVVGVAWLVVVVVLVREVVVVERVRSALGGLDDEQAASNDPAPIRRMAAPSGRSDGGALTGVG